MAFANIIGDAFAYMRESAADNIYYNELMVIFIYLCCHFHLYCPIVRVHIPVNKRSKAVHKENRKHYTFRKPPFNLMSIVMAAPYPKIICPFLIVGQVT
jgi:hypothetical protein